VLVPLEVLVRQEDGSYCLAVDSAVLEHLRVASAGPLVLPILAEALDILTRCVETGRVRLHKTVQTREALGDEPLVREEVIIERVPVNRVVEGPSPSVRM
jgi:hypothetical protein